MADAVHQVLGVVEQEQQPGLADYLRQLTSRLPRDPEGGGHRLGHRGRVTNRREVDEPDAVGEVWADLRGEFEGDACLPAAARTSQRYQARPLKDQLQLFDLGAPAD